jgi:hypothetical protein
MARGRRPERTGLVQRLVGSDGAKARLEAILEVLAGGLTVSQACRRLALSARRFHGLRAGALQAALGGLEPRPSGRPAESALEGDSRVAALQAEVQSLRLELRAAQVREEIAIAMPQLLRARGKKAARRKRVQRKTRSGGGRTASGRSGSLATSLAAGVPPDSDPPASASAAPAPGRWPLPAGRLASA